MYTMCTTWYVSGKLVTVKEKKVKRNRKANIVVKERRAKLIQMARGKCRDCRILFDDYMFDFHHVNPDSKKFSLTGKNLTRKWDDVLVEFKKCVLLCPNCHRIRHNKLGMIQGPK